MLLTNTASRDGNLLLNIGPDRKGQVPPDQIARLTEMGDWLRMYGSAIYETRGGPFLPTPHATSTRRQEVVFLHVLPDEHDSILKSIRMPRLPGGPELKAARLLVGETPVTFQPAGDHIKIAVPDRPAGAPTQVIKLTYTRSVMEVVPVPLP